MQAGATQQRRDEVQPNFLNESQALWLDTVNRFMDNEVTVEYVRKCDQNRDYPYEAYDKIAKQGWLGLLFSEEEDRKSVV